MHTHGMLLHKSCWCLVRPLCFFDLFYCVFFASKNNTIWIIRNARWKHNLQCANCVIITRRLAWKYTQVCTISYNALLEIIYNYIHFSAHPRLVSLDWFPDELVVHILSFMLPSALQHICQTSSRLYGLLEEENIFYTIHKINNDNYVIHN